MSSIACCRQSAVEILLLNFSLQAGCRAMNRLMKCMHGMKKQIISGNSATKPLQGWGGDRKIKLILFHFSL